jgi:hypothetical protein
MQDILEMAMSVEQYQTRFMTDMKNRIENDPLFSPAALKHLELFKLTQDILDLTSGSPNISSTAGLSLTQLNSRLCGWHEDLPVELRWNKWGSSFEIIDPKVASMQLVALPFHVL